MKLRAFIRLLLPLQFIVLPVFARPCDRDRLVERLEKAYLNASFLGSVVKKVEAEPIEVKVPETLALDNGKNGYSHFVGKKIIRVYLKTHTVSSSEAYQVPREDPVNENFLFAHDFGTLDGDCVAITNNSSWNTKDATGISQTWLRKWPFETRAYSVSCVWLADNFNKGLIAPSDPHVAEYIGEIGRSNRLMQRILKMCSEMN